MLDLEWEFTFVARDVDGACAFKSDDGVEIEYVDDV